MNTDLMVIETICAAFNYLPLAWEADEDEMMAYREGNEAMQDHMANLIMQIRPAVESGELLPEDLLSLILQAQDKMSVTFPTMRNPDTRTACL